LTEFNNAGCLLISEVKYLLENRDKDAPDTAYDFWFCSLSSFSPLASVYNKTLEYVKTFAKFNTTDSASAVRESVLVIIDTLSSP
jgi:DNA-directed RNA polymerase II subunit RPB4